MSMVNLYRDVILVFKEEHEHENGRRRSLIIYSDGSLLWDGCKIDKQGLLENLCARSLGSCRGLSGERIEKFIVRNKNEQFLLRRIDNEGEARVPRSIRPYGEQKESDNCSTPAREVPAEKKKGKSNAKDNRNLAKTSKATGRYRLPANGAGNPKSVA